MSAPGTSLVIKSLLVKAALVTCLSATTAYAIPTKVLPGGESQAPASFDFSSQKGLNSDPQLLGALEQLNKGDIDQAIVETKAYLSEHPRSQKL